MGDIGCYSLGVAPPWQLRFYSMYGCKCWNDLGAELALKENIKGKIVGVIGDSTLSIQG